HVGVRISTSCTAEHVTGARGRGQNGAHILEWSVTRLGSFGGVFSAQDTAQAEERTGGLLKEQTYHRRRLGKNGQSVTPADVPIVRDTETPSLMELKQVIIECNMAITEKIDVVALTVVQQYQVMDEVRDRVKGLGTRVDDTEEMVGAHSRQLVMASVAGKQIAGLGR
ncbi:hypothetical protein NDU88_001406, partial [Pleurodeles waltl]